jgi:hypothetical protein
VQAVKLGTSSTFLAGNVHVLWIRFADRVIGVQGRVHCHIKKVHHLGDGRLVRLCAFADVLE